MTVHNPHTVRFKLLRGQDNMLHQRSTGEWVQHFGDVGMHARALAGGQDNHFDCSWRGRAHGNSSRIAKQ